MSLKPRLRVPELDLPLVGGGRFKLSAEKPDAFTMLIVYRGLHCPIFRTYLADLNSKSQEFERLGVRPIAVSSDSPDRAVDAKQLWKLADLRVAYGMPVSMGREWGLSVSKAISDREPAEFLEPGLFLVRPDMTLYAASVQTMPFARPHFDDILGALRFVTTNSYPARGEA